MRRILFVLGELHDSDLQWMIDTGSVLEAADGDVLIEEGVPNERLLIVIDGKASVRHRAGGGAEITRVGIGELAGEIGLLDSRPPIATVVAVGDVRVFVLEYSTLRTKMERDSGFAARFYRAVALVLANRLDAAQAAPSSADGSPLSEDVRDEGELQPELMDSVALSGARFLSFLSRLEKS